MGSGTGCKYLDSPCDHPGQREAQLCVSVLLLAVESASHGLQCLQRRPDNRCVSLNSLQTSATYVAILVGENVYEFNATKYLDQVFAPTVARTIPFSSTHGNVSFMCNTSTCLKYERHLAR